VYPILAKIAKKTIDTSFQILSRPAPEAIDLAHENSGFTYLADANRLCRGPATCWMIGNRASLIRILFFRAPLLSERTKPDTLREQQPRELVNLISNR